MCVYNFTVENGWFYNHASDRCRTVCQHQRRRNLSKINEPGPLKFRVLYPRLLLGTFCSIHT